MKFLRHEAPDIGGTTTTLSYGLGSRSNFLRTNKRTSCPICADVSGKCGFSANEPIVFCGNTHSGKINGYRFTKPASNPLWSIFAPIQGDRRKSHLSPIRPIQRIKTAAAKRKSIEERDRDYRAMPAELSASRRNNLLKRGLTNEEIDFAIENHWIWNFGKGFAIAALSPEGKIQGCQIARDDRNPKYIWDSKNESGKLPDSDEMPLFPWVHPNCDFSQPIKLIASEGALKPLVAAFKHWRTKDYQTVFVGAAGGNFQPKELARILGFLKPASIQYAPDAGAIANKSVMRTIEQFIDRVKFSGIEPKFLWWGQFSKSIHPDFDELSGIETVKALSVEQFFDLNSRDRMLLKRQFRFNAFWEGGLKRDFQLSHSPPDVEQVEYEGFLTVAGLELESNFYDTIAVQGGLGSGKTTGILQAIARCQLARTLSFFWCSPRRGLNAQTAGKAQGLGIETYDYQENVTGNRIRLESGESGLYFACDESFKDYAFGNVDWSRETLIIDEFSSIRKALSSKAVREEFFRAIAQCGRLIIADAFLSDADIRLIQKLRPGTIQLYRQKAAKSQVSIKWIETRNKQGEISFSHDGAYFDLLQTWVDQGFKRIAIAVDSISYAKAIKEFLEKAEFADGRKPRVSIACSETPEENRLFMPEPDIAIAANRFDVVIYTPTAESGLDIQSEFDRGLLICCGVLSPTGMLQMLGRCRKCPEWWVSAPRRTANPNCSTPSLDGKKIQEWTAKISQSFEEMGFVTQAQEFGWSVWERLIKDVEQAFNSEYIRALLDEYFESVETVELSSNSTTQWRNAITRIKAEDAEKTLNANLQNGIRLLDEQKPPAKNHEIWDVKLAQLWEKYPELVSKLARKIKGDDQQTAIEFGKILLSRRIEKLKNWVVACDADETDDRELLDRMREKATNYNSPAFKLRQNLMLFRRLKLKELAKWTGGKTSGENAHTTHFNMRSPEILKRWEQFQQDYDLQRLFPLIDSLQALWSQIRACMSFFAYQTESAKLRQKTDEKHANGHFRGKERTTQSKVEHFIAWIVMEASGNAFFRDHVDLIVQALRDRIASERDARRKHREKKAEAEKYYSEQGAAAA